MVAEVGNESWCIQATITKIVESEENNPNVTLVCDDDAHKVDLCQYSFFFHDWSFDQYGEGSCAWTWF